ncbi:MAG: single-stranded-DNA-specific exonuclease RecJ [Bdellovibrionales bacterium]|nr:single-stranded-DNA-specific exonuclease RecJ [Bdellovibrionales bacterium]
MKEQGASPLSTDTLAQSPGVPSESAGVFPKNFPKALRRWLESRGFSEPEQIQQLLHPKLKDLSDPLKLLNLKKAAVRLVDALQQNETIGLFGDFDLDGTTGLLVLYEGFSGLGFQKLVTAQPSRLHDGYGLSAKAVDDFHQLGAKVLVSVDVGTNALEAGNRCREHKIDFIVADHHLAGADIASAYALINPNQPGCDSGLGHLAGCGVGFYLLLGVRQEMRARGLETSGFDPKSVLDLVTIGTLTDLTQLKAENRILMKHGLHGMKKSTRPAIREMVARAIEADFVGSLDVAFQIAPRLNALSRLEQGLTPYEFLKERDPARISRLVEDVWKANELRKKLQADAYERSVQKLKAEQTKGFAWVWDANFHKGIIGLVATKLSQDCMGGAFVGALDEAKGIITGSARLVDGHPANLSQVLSACGEVLESHGGHAQAAGFRLKQENAERFRELLQQQFHGFKELALEKYDVSAIPIVELSELNDHLVGAISLLEPFGKGFPYPRFLLKNLTVAGVVNMKGGHLRLKVKEAARFEVKEVLRFSPLPDESAVRVGDQVDLVVEPQFNWYLGQRRFQLNGVFIQKAK